MLMPTVFHENLFDDFFDPFWNDAALERMMNREARDTFGCLLYTSQHHHRSNVSDHHPVELLAAEVLAVALHLVNDVILSLIHICRGSTPTLERCFLRWASA